MPIIGDPGLLQRLGGNQRCNSAQFVAGPPAHNRYRSTGSHSCALIRANLLDAKRVNRDVLSRGCNRDNERDSDDTLKVGHWIKNTPEREAGQDHGLKAQDPCPAMSQSCREKRYLYPINQGRP